MEVTNKRNQFYMIQNRKNELNFCKFAKYVNPKKRIECKILSNAISRPWLWMVLNFLGILSSKKWLLIILTICSGIIAYGISWTLPNWYASTVTFVPPNNANSMISGMMGNVSSALKDLGLGKMNKGESYSYMVVLNSRSLMDTLINKYNLPRRI